MCDVICSQGNLLCVRIFKYSKRTKRSVKHFKRLSIPAFGTYGSRVPLDKYLWDPQFVPRPDVCACDISCRENDATRQEFPSCGRLFIKKKKTVEPYRLVFSFCFTGIIQKRRRREKAEKKQKVKLNESYSY